MKTTPLNLILWLSILLISCLYTQKSYAQEQRDSTSTWEIETDDGNRYYGLIIYEDAELIILKTKTIGELKIKQSVIQSIKAIDPKLVKRGQPEVFSKVMSHYLIGPSAFNLRQGESYYKNTWVLLNQVNVGITDQINVGVGIMPLILFDIDVTPIWLTPKVSIPIQKNKFSLGIGAFGIGFLGDEVDNDFSGMVYAVGTVGSPRFNFSAGLGYGFNDDDWAEAPTFTISVMGKIGKRTYLISENYLFQVDNDPYLFCLAGLRTAWDSISLDYGALLAGDINYGGVMTIPWLSVIIPIGD